MLNITKSNALQFISSVQKCNQTSRVIQSVFRNCSDIKTNENKSADENVESAKIGGFAKAYEKHRTSHINTPIPEKNVSFASLLKNSKFVDLGDPEGKVVNGKVFHTVGDDLYIDFGWKFHCVCPRPQKNGNEFVRGARVRLRIKSLELSTRFLGSQKDLTILEADCHLLGLASSPARRQFANN